MIRTKKADHRHNTKLAKSISDRTKGLSYYVPDFARQVYLLALLGARDEDVAKIFKVTHGTIEHWREMHPEFGKAMMRGKMEFDCLVAESLGKRAMGYDYTETEVTKRPNMRTGKIETTTKVTNKHVPPSEVACIFWLKNRQRDIWADTNRIESYHNVNVNINHRVNLTLLSEEEKQVLKNAIVRQLGSGTGHN